MEIRRETEQTNQPATSQNPVNIGSGEQGTILLDPEAKVVYKKFRSLDGYDAGYLAGSEFEYLTRLSDVLKREPFLGCPEPLGVTPDQGMVTMSHCPGERLDQFLATPEPDVAKHLEHIADQLSRATELYIQEFGEPYYDLGQHNILYDADECRLYLLDFMTMGDVRSYYKQEHDPTDFSLGNFIGTSVYHTVRPSTWKNEVYWQRVRETAIGVVDRVRERQDLSPATVRTISHKVYGVWALDWKPMRMVWYSTLAHALFRRRLNEILWHMRE